MSNTTDLKRKDAPIESTWNREAVYPTWKDWEADLKVALKELPELSEYNGRLKEGPGVLADLIKRLMEDMRRMLAFNPHFVTPQQHLEIIEALKHGDRAKAEQAMKRHMEETKSSLLDRF